MAERAEKIGGKLKCQSALASGTQITLIVPANRAYLPRFGLRSLLRKMSPLETDL
jgi:hypothetical protein